ncbi:MAG: Trk-type K+ transporter membrane component [Cytophagales bacterium]|nr:Trk-type K+ transporter membrane component [Cytophagales bacterium]MDW8383662.1 potassium transporter TrkG [Flammeovirgaceae bacterium]
MKSTVADKVNSFLYGIRTPILTFLKIISIFNVLIAVSLLIYRFGFHLSEEEVSNVLVRFDVLFLVFVTIYFLRMIFALNRKQYLKETQFEFLLCFFVFIHCLCVYLFDFIPNLWLMRLLKLKNPELSHQHILSFYMLLLVGLEVVKWSGKISELELKPATTFILSFLLLISMGTFLLMLPAMTQGKEGVSYKESMPFLDALFTAVSASCVTGLAVEDTGTYFTFRGHLVIMVLMQLGGLGVVSFTTFFASYMAKGVSLKHQSIIQDFLGSETLIGAKDMLRKIVFITLLVESIGAILIFFSWDPNLQFKNGLSDKVFYSIFHSISAFCNAGFCLFSDSLYTDKEWYMTPEGETIYLNVREMYQLHFVIAIIIILGGLGFATIEDIYHSLLAKVRRPWLLWNINTKVSVTATIILISLGLIGFFILEFDQLTNRTIIEALNTAFFQSVTTRTAGFNTMDFATLRTPTIILVIFLMFIGGCSGSTAGGIKTSTFYLIAKSAFDTIRGQQDVVIAYRKIENETIKKAYSVFMFATTYNVIAIFLLSITEADNPEISILNIFFEQVSAFATVGLSMGITAKLSTLGKIIIIVSMFIGRIGTLTLALALSNRVVTNKFHYPKGYLMVG